MSAYHVEREEIKILDEDVIFGGVFVGHFGVFMAQCLSRFWYIVQHAESDKRIVILFTPSDRPFHYEFLRLLDVPKERLCIIDQPTQFRSIIVPEMSVIALEYYSPECLIPYQYIRKKIVPRDAKKVYLSKTRYDSKKKGGVITFNEMYFEKFFADRGYKVVAPEELTIEEQLSVVTGADEIVCMMSTLSHFAWFCKPNTKFIMLTRTSNTMLVLQCIINEVTAIDWHIVDVSRNFMNENHYGGICLIAPTKYWKQFVQDYFGERIDDYYGDHWTEIFNGYVERWCQRYSTLGLIKTLTNAVIRVYRRLLALENRAVKDRPQLCYETHVAIKGWLPQSDEDYVSGVPERRLDVQAIKIYFNSTYYDVYYAVYYPTEGWAAEVSTAHMAGTTGKGKPIMGIKLRLDDGGAKYFDVLYRVHKFVGGWSQWAKNGEELISLKSKINAVQIRLEGNPHALLAKEVRSDGRGIT